MVRVKTHVVVTGPTPRKPQETQNSLTTGTAALITRDRAAGTPVTGTSKMTIATSVQAAAAATPGMMAGLVATRVVTMPRTAVEPWTKLWTEAWIEELTETWIEEWIVAKTET